MHRNVLTVVRSLLLGGLLVNPLHGQGHSLVVALDGYHKNESMPHYRWEGTYQGGFSDLGGLLQSLGAKLKTITTPIFANNLNGVDCLLIVAPDTPSKVPHPAYIAKSEIKAITRWVKRGGVLVLLGNDPGNSEFEHLNQLAAQFGIRFLEETHRDAQGSVKLTLHASNGQSIIRTNDKLYAVQIAPIGLKTSKAIRFYEDNGQVLMASVDSGSGRVLAFGDPWLYNEYIHTDDNYQIASQLFRWLLLHKTKGAL